LRARAGRLQLFALLAKLSAGFMQRPIRALFAAARPWLTFSALAAALLISIATPGIRAQTPATPILNVVLIDGQDMGRPLLLQFQTELRRTLADRNGGRLSLYLESADVSRFPGPEHIGNFERWLERKYANKRIDLVIATANLPLDRVLAWRTSVWKGAPLVIGLLDPKAASRLPSEPGVSALLWVPEVDSTLDLVRALFPSTRRIMLVGGAAYGDLPGEWIRAQLQQRSGMQIVDTGNRPVAELDDFVASLPDDTVVLYSGVYSDAAGQGYQPQQVLESISTRTARPIVGLSPSYIDHGMLGGGVIDVALYARQAADLGLRMKDHPGLVVPAVEVSRGAKLTVDYRQLQRWNAKLDRLPVGTTVLFQPPSLWEAHKATVLTAAVIGGLLSLTVAALLVERARRRQAEVGLKGLSGRLLSGQESERNRIAKDLHDDVNQRLALLALGLDGIASSKFASATVVTRANVLGEEARQLSADVHGIALQLRPPQLGAMGLPAALRSLGARIQERSEVRVDVIERGWPKSLSSDIEIVLYRVVQEALQNVIKHSAASSVRVVLAVADGIAEATVLDDGKGLDGPHTDAGEKLGLIGMRERLALVQGTLKVQGGPESGTWLAARVPLPPTADDRG
jgi:signal transduction histidine kinase